jgi:16S rRNA (guanine(527)-N(7))-methyltransferase RsmG
LSFEEDLRLAGRGALSDHGALTAPVLFQLEALDRLLVRWSTGLDLVGFRTREERIRRYFAEPLAASTSLPSEGRALDIGSGGGSPGLPFAIVRPGLDFILLEPRRKRRLFLEEASRELGLRNVEVRAERFERGAVFDLAAISTRGVRLSLEDLDAVFEALSIGGRFLWLGGAARLLGAAGELAGRLRVLGPTPLLPGSDARLLVVTREA